MGETVRTWAHVPAVAGVYILLAIGGLLLARATSLSSPVWPAAGWGIAAALIWRKGWVGVVVGAAAANLGWLALTGRPVMDAVPVAAAIGVGNGMEAMYGGWLLRNFDRRFKAVVWFLLAMVACCCVASAVGVTAQLFGGVVDVWNAPQNWWTWWAGDFLGVILFAPIIRHLW